MVTALYRRYRPESFAEMIGQSQVTEPLMTALRTNRVNHAYLFSGPRGCGKTTSARILARCLNCAEGPTDTPCGKCPSCIELGRGGGGSLDVVEIDAASHNGVDDARDIRERAVFAPARDRYKVFILDEAHMVTPQGFNALLKIVEEPPEHVKFIFATTEPDKVIGTIRSRTHHYPFRLVPPGQMLDYVQQLCETEGVAVAPGVLPLVVRAGGGSPRDTLSLLDQLMAGSESSTVEYERAVALLGYTHASLLNEVVSAIAVRDAAGAFGSVDRVIQTGQDPRRFVEDLLERLRDLIVVQATSTEAAAAVLRGVPQEELERMSIEASQFGAAELSRAADLVNAALTEMTGATSPRLHLELMIARMLVPSSDESERGALARVERLERRVGVSDAIAGSAGAASSPESGQGSVRPVEAAIADVAPVEPRVVQPAVEPVVSRPAAERSVSQSQAEPAVAEPGGPEAENADSGNAELGNAELGNAEPGNVVPGIAVTASAPSAAAASAGATPQAGAPVGDVTTQQVKDSWPLILESVEKTKRSAWVVIFTAQVRSLAGDVLTLTFPSDNDVASFRQQQAGQGVSEYLRQAILDVLGIRVKFIAKTDAVAAGTPLPVPPASPEPQASSPRAADAAPAADTGRPANAGQPANSARSASASPKAAAVSTPASQSQADPSAADPWPAVAIPGGGVEAPADDGWPAVAIPGGAAALASNVPDDVPPPIADEPSDWGPEPDEEQWPGDAQPEYAAALEASAAALEKSAAGLDTSGSPQRTPAAPPSTSAPRQSPSAKAKSAPADASPKTRRPDESTAAASTERSVAFQEPQRYGEAVVREILGANFIEEQSVPPGAGR